MTSFFSGKGCTGRHQMLLACLGTVPPMQLPTSYDVCPSNVSVNFIICDISTITTISIFNVFVPLENYVYPKK